MVTAQNVSSLQRGVLAVAFGIEVRRAWLARCRRNGDTCLTGFSIKWTLRGAFANLMLGNLPTRTNFRNSLQLQREATVGRRQTPVKPAAVTQENLIAAQ
jgi:hypothetical protein